jgi:hypothetical protein
MRRLPLILGLALIIAMTAREVYDFFVTNASIQYFSSQPRRLLYVLLLGVAGGVVALVISRLSPGAQRTLKLTALGAFGTFLVAVLGLFAYHLMSSASMVTEARMWGWVAVAYTMFVVIAAVVWLEFRQVWKQGEMERPTNGSSK